jgi:hypothetical protein
MKADGGDERRRREKEGREREIRRGLLLVACLHDLLLLPSMNLPSHNIHTELEATKKST